MIGEISIGTIIDCSGSISFHLLSSIVARLKLSLSISVKISTVLSKIKISRTWDNESLVNKLEKVYLSEDNKRSMLIIDNLVECFFTVEKNNKEKSIMNKTMKTISLLSLQQEVVTLGFIISNMQHRCL